DFMTHTLCFFFFQAEDGIRDFHVTGVQTCALPICSDMPIAMFTPYESLTPEKIAEEIIYIMDNIMDPKQPLGLLRAMLHEEYFKIGRARVGKECRSRWGPDQEKKKKRRGREERQEE